MPLSALVRAVLERFEHARWSFKAQAVLVAAEMPAEKAVESLAAMFVGRVWSNRQSVVAEPEPEEDPLPCLLTSLSAQRGPRRWQVPGPGQAPRPVRCVEGAAAAA